MKPTRETGRGFTLVEILMVTIVIAALAAVTIPRFAQVGRSSADRAAEANLRQAFTAARSVLAATGTYSGADHDALAGELNGIAVLDATTAATGDGRLSVHTTATTWAVATWSSRTGTCLLLATGTDGVVRSGRSRSTICTGTRATSLVTGTFVANDHIADAALIEPLAVGTPHTTAPITIGGATLEAGETGPGTLARTAWWTYTAVRSERIAITGTLSTIGISVSLRSAGAVSATQVTSCSSPTAASCTIAPTLTAGTTYWIQLNTPTTTGDPTATLTLTNAPLNDDLAAAVIVPSQAAEATWTGDWVDSTVATRETGETGTWSWEGTQRTVWYRYTPPTDQRVRLSVHTSGSPAAYWGISVRTSPSVSAATVASDQSNGPLNWTLPVMTLTGGTTYWIQLFNTKSLASITPDRWLTRLVVETLLEVVPAPGNDAVATAAVIDPVAPGGSWTGTPVTASFATAEAGETGFVDPTRTWHTFTPRRSVWYRYSPTVTQSIRFGMNVSGSATGTSQLTVRASASVSAPLIESCSGTAPGCTAPAITVTAGQTYWIQLFHETAAPDGGAWVVTPLVRTDPPNDAIGAAQPIDPLGYDATWTGPTIDATWASAEPGETGTGSPYSGWTVRRTLWWSYTPTVDQGVTFRATRSGATTQGLSMTIRASRSVTAPIVASCWMWTEPNTCAASAGMTAGTTYWIQVHTTGSVDTASWLVSLSARTGPANDNIAAAQVIAPLAAETTWTGDVVTATFATREPGETGTGDWRGTQRTLWYRYTPTADQRVQFSFTTSGSPNIYWGISVRTSPSVSAATLATTQSNGPLAWTMPTMTLTAGQTYWIQLFNTDSATTDTWMTRLTVRALLDVVPAPANDAVGDAATIPVVAPGSDWTGTPITASFATAEAGETGFVDPTRTWYTFTPRRSVWYRYSPASNQSVRFGFSASGSTGNASLLTVRSSASATAPILASCSGGTTGCRAPAVLATAAQTYWVQVFNEGAQPDSGSWIVTPTLTAPA
jgi:prepilin-type N-terminal cleavage/methylation domain-containing protein